MEKTTVYSLIADRWLVATLPLGKLSLYSKRFLKKKKIYIYIYIFLLLYYKSRISKGKKRQGHR